MKKIIISIIVGILAVVTVISVGINVNNKKHERAELSYLSDRSLQLTVEKNTLLEQRKKTVSLRDAETKIGNYVVLFFDSVDENLIDAVYPLLKENEYTGTIVLCHGLVPGEEGNISKADFDFLLDNGWDYAIGYSNGVDMDAENAAELLAEYLDDYLARLSAVGIEAPVTYCFNQGEYKAEFESVLWERGFRIIRHGGEAGSMYGSAYNPDSFYYIGTGICCSSSTSLQDNVDVAYEDDLAYSMSVRYIADKSIDTKRDCTTVKYQRMLTYLKTYCQGIVVCPIGDLYRYKIDQFESALSTVGEYNAQIAAIDVEIEKVDEELEEVLKQLK